MAIHLDEEILQDFLVEAGEILEQLNEQLVNLEQSPDNYDLLNAIFRGFHTIKGGGSFLHLTNLVEICHQSEDVINLLRNRVLILNAAMMDAFLRVLDEVKKMFEEVRNGVNPTAADPALLLSLIDMQNLNLNSVGVFKEKREVVITASDAINNFVTSEGEITDEEFENLLDTLQKDNESKSNTKPKEVVNDNKILTDNSDEINVDEFEALIDNLHGIDAGPKNTLAKSIIPKKENSSDSKFEMKADEISDDEFESLLDDIDGKGKGKGPYVTKQSEPNQNCIQPNELGLVTTPEPNDKHVVIAQPKTLQVDATVRVNTARLDDIMNLVGELVLARNRLNTLKETFKDERVHKAISNLDLVTVDLQTAVMKTRMQPVKKVFGRFPRVVRDMARTLNKEIELKMKGEETDLDKNLIEALADPLVHLVRNSVDHGIESPEVRDAAGKSRVGIVTLTAQQEGDHILLSITDDGAGMDPEILRNKVIEKGLMDVESASRLDNKGCFDLIFMPGLSTNKEITNVSGRGVGMDVVKTKITQLNGSIDVDSILGEGTTLKIKVPLTLAILPTLMIQLGNRKFALPLSNVSEIFELNSKNLSVVDGRKVILHQGKSSPIFYLRSWLLKDTDSTEFDLKKSQVIMVKVASTPVGLVVDRVIGQEEVVIKPLGAMLYGLPGMAGSTITGDGNIAIILDVQGLLKQFA